MKSIKSDLLHSPNDLIALSKDSFYVVNDHKYSKGYKKILENVGLITAGNILLYQNDKFHLAADGLLYPNSYLVTVGRGAFVNLLSLLTIHACSALQERWYWSLLLNEKHV